MAVRGMPTLELPPLPPQPQQPAEWVKLSRRERKELAREQAAYDTAWEAQQTAQQEYTASVQDFTQSAAELAGGDLLVLARMSRAKSEHYTNPADYIQDLWETSLSTPNGPQPYLSDQVAQEFLTEIMANNGSVGPKVQAFLLREYREKHIYERELTLMCHHIAPENFLPTGIDAIQRAQLADSVLQTLTAGGVPETVARVAAVRTIADLAAQGPRSTEWAERILEQGPSQPSRGQG